MDQFFLCAACGEENEISLDPESGESIELTQDCRACGKPNVIRATYNYYANEFDLEVFLDTSA